PTPPPPLVPDPAPMSQMSGGPAGMSEVPPPPSEPPTDKPTTGRRAVHVRPFGNGSVAHGNVLHLKVDGTIEKLEGAGQPTGVTVVVPHRRSLEAAAPLASRDSRIGSIHVSNDSGGAELSVVFKDGVPNYQVRAKGDVLEIVLAPPGAMRDAKKDDAKKDD